MHRGILSIWLSCCLIISDLSDYSFDPIVSTNLFTKNTAGCPYKVRYVNRNPNYSTVGDSIENKRPNVILIAIITTNTMFILHSTIDYPG